MNESLAIWSTTTLTDAQFAHFLATIGAETVDDGIYEGRRSADACTVWITRSPESLEELAADVPARLREIERRLGGWPTTCVLLDMSSTPGSEHLALELSIQFADVYTCVVTDPAGHVYTSDEVRALYTSGRSFDDVWHDPVQV